MENLANKMRPKKLSDILGQEHLIGEGKILTNLVKNHHLCSMIFYGKPGTGKTSIANALVNEIKMNTNLNNKEISEYLKIGKNRIRNILKKD